MVTGVTGMLGQLPVYNPCDEHLGHREGQLRYLLIPNFPKALGLKDVKLEWLMEGVLPRQMAGR